MDSPHRLTAIIEREDNGFVALCPLLLPASGPVASDHNPAIGERFLLTDLVIAPLGCAELGENELSTSAGFS